MLCAAQMEEIDSSKELGSSMSAGIRVFKSSAGLELEDGRTDVDSGSRDAPLHGGGLNLTVGFVYGCGRVLDERLRTRNRSRRGRVSLVSVCVSDPDGQTSILLNAVAAKWKSPAGNKLDRIR